MRGLFYNAYIQNKTRFLISVLIFIGICAAEITIALCLENDNPITQVLVALLSIFGSILVMGIAFSVQSAKTEKLIKNGFLKFIMTSGVSKKTYILTDFLENIFITIVSGAAAMTLAALLLLISPNVFDNTVYLFAAILVLFDSALTTLENSLTLFTKKSEASDLIIGLSFAAIFAVYFCVIDVEKITIEVNSRLLLIVLGGWAAIHAVSGAISFFKLKNLC